MAVMLREAHEYSKEEWDLDSDATFPTSHTRTGMTAYKKASPGRTVEVTDGTIIPVDGSGTIEVDLDQPGTTTKPVKIVTVAYMPESSRTVLSTCKAVKQWGKQLIYYQDQGCFGVPGKELLVFIFSSSERLFFATGVRQNPS